MDCIVTFDTNFIIDNKSDINNILKDIKRNYNIAIAKLVIEEIKGQRVRLSIKNYETIMKKIEEAKKENKWLKIEDKTDIDAVLEKQEERLETWLVKEFDNNVIDVGYDNFMSVVMNRCKYKKPPFNNDDNSSDKGFKDTLLFLILMEYMKVSKENKIYLITNDKIIIKFKNELEKEFLEKTNKDLNIISGDKENIYKILEIESQSEEKTQESEKSKEIDDIIVLEKTKERENIVQETLEILNNIFSNLNYSSRGNFSLWTKIENGKIKEFLEDLYINIECYVFMDEICIHDIIDIDSTKDGKIKVENLKKLSELYLEMSDKNKDALVLALTNRLNEYYVELPF